MARARNQLLPMNLADKDIVGTMKDRQKIGASLADVDPMTIDKSVSSNTTSSFILPESCPFLRIEMKFGVI